MYSEPYKLNQTVTGMLKKLKMIQLVTNNIANANTIGYKRQIPESLNFQSVLSKAREETTMHDASQGPLKKTSEVFDLGIEGNAYFLVESKSGITPTRVGRFRLNEESKLVTQEGDEVVIVEKTNKDINLAKQNDIRINHAGEIIVDGEKYGRIAMQIMDNKQVRVHQGFIEGSNVDLMREMVSLSLLFRSFEASEKTLGMEASVDRDLIEKYGRNV